MSLEGFDELLCMMEPLIKKTTCRKIITNVTVSCNLRIPAVLVVFISYMKRLAK